MDAKVADSIARDVLRLLTIGAPVLLVALHPLVFILRSHSASDPFPFAVIARPAAVVIAAALLVLLSLRAITGSMRFASVAGTFFFVVLGLFPFMFAEGDYQWPVSLAFALAFLAVGVGLARLLDGMAGVVVTWVLAVVVIWNAGAAYLISAAIWPEPLWRDHVDGAIARAASIKLPAGSERPDIYYIVLDGMARLDVLDRLYGLPGRDAIGALEELGLQIPRLSRSNYSQTQLSLASSLNMQYLDDLSRIMGASAVDRRPLMRLIEEPGAVTALKRHGYDIVVVTTATSLGTHHDEACRSCSLPPGPTEFEHALLMRIPVPHSYLHRAALRAHRHQVLRSFDLIESATSDGPMFLMAHIVSPHPPFVMAPDGTERLGQRGFTFIDGRDFPGSRAEYIGGYRAQAAFVLARVTRMVERIVARSPRAYIVIHSDHGSGLGLVKMDASRTDPFERLAIFSAYYSGGRDTPVPDTMSPVNALRWVFRNGLGAEVPLLADRSFLSDYLRPYHLVEIAPDQRHEGSR